MIIVRFDPEKDLRDYPKIHFDRENKPMYRHYEGGLKISCCYSYDTPFHLLDTSIKRKIKCFFTKHDYIRIHYCDFDEVCFQCKHKNTWNGDYFM